MLLVKVVTVPELIEMSKKMYEPIDKMINLRPRQNNRSRGVEDNEIRKAIIEIANEIVSL